MSIGKNIKQFRELRNYTQSYLAEKLNMSVGGYGKIERDETDLTLTRLNQIAEILQTDISNILNFDSNQVFNQYNNKTATQNGVVQNQQIISDTGLDIIFQEIKLKMTDLEKEIFILKNK